MSIGSHISKIHYKWSTPKIMFALMLIGMVLILSFESLGFALREQNIGIRFSNPEILIKRTEMYKLHEKYNSAILLDRLNQQEQAKLRASAIKIQESLSDRNMNVLLGAAISNCIRNSNDFPNAGQIGLNPEIELHDSMACEDIQDLARHIN